MPYFRNRNNNPKPAPKHRGRAITPPDDPIPCVLVFSNGTRVKYKSRTQAKKALGRYVRDLPSDPNGQKKVWIENK